MFFQEENKVIDARMLSLERVFNLFLLSLSMLGLDSHSLLKILSIIISFTWEKRSKDSVSDAESKSRQEFLIKILLQNLYNL